MGTPESTGGRRGSFAAAAASLALAVLAVVALVRGLTPSDGPPSPPAPVAGAAAASGSATFSAGEGDAAGQASPPDAVPLSAPTVPRSRPVGLDIPSIGVSSSRLVELGKNPDGSLQVPADYATPGWYTPGPAPGQLGAAILAGHVDSDRGPAVFFRLGELHPGADVAVRDADGSVLRFVVDRVERYPKDRFPTDEVYGATPRAELRLITCGGTFDRTSRHYLDNVVAFAHLAESAP